MTDKISVHTKDLSSNIRSICLENSNNSCPQGDGFWSIGCGDSNAELVGSFCYCKPGYTTTDTRLTLPGDTREANIPITEIDNWNTTLHCTKCGTSVKKAHTGNDNCTTCPVGTRPNKTNTGCIDCNTVYQEIDLSCSTPQHCHDKLNRSPGLNRYIGQCSDSRYFYNGIPHRTNMYRRHTQADVQCNFGKCQLIYAVRRAHPSPVQAKYDNWTWSPTVVKTSRPSDGASSKKSCLIDEPGWTPHQDISHARALKCEDLTTYYYT
jgi:hypothetical protein